MFDGIPTMTSVIKHPRTGSHTPKSNNDVFFRIIVFFWKKNNTCLNPFYNEMSITVVHKNLPPNHIKPRGQTQSQLPNVFTMWIKYLSRYTHACLYTQLHTYGHIQTRYIWYMYISFCPGGTTTVATESTSSSSSHKLYLIPPLNVLLVQRVCVCVDSIPYEDELKWKRTSTYCSEAADLIHCKDNLKRRPHSYRYDIMPTNMYTCTYIQHHHQHIQIYYTLI